MESIEAYQDILSRPPEWRDVDVMIDPSATKYDVEMSLTAFHWGEK